MSRFSQLEWGFRIISKYKLHHKIILLPLEEWEEVPFVYIKYAVFQGVLLDWNAPAGPILYFNLTKSKYNKGFNFIWISENRSDWWENPVQAPCPTYILEHHSVSERKTYDRFNY